ncbi:MAG: hypothetical protein HC831_00320 [Chloroflexia bacterium]|nr:hypothetical protein [Chloroflexia bacterium]
MKKTTMLFIHLRNVEIAIEFRRVIALVLWLLLISVFLISCAAESKDKSQIPLAVLGKIKPLNARDIDNSLLSIGAETMDRDYTVYENWKEYLGPLGFKKARIQAGWAKTEQTPGQYNWQWFDAIVYDMVEQGVEPWVNLAWGNKLYTEEYGERGGPPKTEAQFHAWEKFIRALVSRYREHIDEWEIWNESKKLTAEEEATLIIRTAQIIKEIQPGATVIIFAMEHRVFRALVDEKYCSTIKEQNGAFNCDYAKEVLDIIASKEKLSLIDEISFHPYEYNPDEINPFIDTLKNIVKKYGSHLKIRQGENGVPSEINEERALANHPWTETAQAKWALRRMISDLGHGIESSYFSIADMKYQEEINRKGLLYINEDKTIHHPKEAYYALQHMATIFNNGLVAVPNTIYRTESSIPISLFSFANTLTQNSVIAIWRNDQVPDEKMFINL